LNHTSQQSRPGFELSALGFLSGGGEMGALIRAYDWASTPLGDPQTWPQSLKTAVRIMLLSRQPIWIGWGKDLTYFYNDPYKSIIGGKHPWALGRPTSEVWSEIWDDIGPMLDTAMGGHEGTYVEEQLLIMERNGYPEETYYTFSYTPIPNDDGTPGGIICVNTDDTHRVIGDRQLALLRELATAASDARTWREACQRSAAALAVNRHDIPFAAIYVADQEGRSVSIAAASGIEPRHAALPETVLLEGGSIWPFAEVLSDQEVLLVPDLEAKTGESLPAGPWPRSPSQVALIPILPAGETGRAGVLVVGLNPFRLFDEGYRSFLALAAGQIGSAIANAQAYEEERRRAEALAEIDRAKTLFFSNVSHEFRTPLTLMMGPMEDVLSKPEGDIPPADRELIRTAHRNGRRLLKLVNSLLDFSRLEADRAQASYEPTDLSAFTAELASNFRSATEKAGLELTVDCPALPEPVYVDHEMWEKVVLNLVSNAFKFTFDGGITVSLRAAPEAAVLSVRDTGTGIPKAELSRLFERFHRVEGARGRSFEGSGIGLALVQELVKLHGGSINVESEEGRGTTFHITIPFGKEHLPADRIREATSLTPSAARAFAYVEEALHWLPNADAEGDATERTIVGSSSDIPVSSSEKRFRILVADDNPDMRGYVQRLLGTQHQVEAVPDGQAALDAARARRPDLILTDIMMPRLDGFGLIRAVRDEPTLRDVPVIALSARAGEEASVEGIAAGADDYLVKPFSARELIARVNGALDMARMRRQMNEALRESEERFRNMADNSPVMIWTTDPGGLCTFISRSWYEFTGHSPETALGRGWLEATHPDDRGRLEEIFLAANERGEPFSLEYRLRRHDGSYGWGLESATPWLGKDGSFLGYIGSVVDITDLKEAELQAARLAAIVSSSEDAIISKNLDGRITSWNSGAAKLFGYEAEEMIGQSILRLIPPELHREEEDIIERLGKGERIEHFDTIRLTKDGRKVDVSITVSPLSDKSGKVIGASKIAREITVRKQLEEAQRQLNELLEKRVAEVIAEREQAEMQLRQAQKMEAVGKLTGGVAHDFNNLLQVIGGNLELLSKELAGNARAEERVRNALLGVSRGSKLASQLLAFGRRQPLAPKVVNLGRLVRGMDDMLRRSIGEAVEVDTVISGGLWNTFVDTVQMENALLNLAINARDAMDGHGKLTIEAGNSYLDDAYAAGHADVSPGQYVMLAVTDTGCGIPAEILDRVTEPFFTTKPEGQGTGLGLSMVYGFVKQSGGHVNIYSEPGEGTTVRIYLPRARQQEDVAVEFKGGTAVGGTETVLVVEDDEGVRATAVDMLSDLGYRVLQANDADSALIILESDVPIDVLFTDVVMPGTLRSPELARKARERLPNIAVLFTSGYTQNAIIHHGRLDEGVELLSKPYSREELARKIRQVLGNQQQRTDAQPAETRSVAESGTQHSEAASTEGARPLRVLLVEDEALIRFATADMLDELGHAVLEAGDAEEALRLLGENPVDVLLTDFSLPGTSGGDLAAEALHRLPDLRVIFASGHDLSRAKNLPAGAGHLMKPYTIEGLAAVLKSVMR
jgi:PAS domain S-box-containing protein